MLISAWNSFIGYIVCICEPEPSIHLNGASNHCQLLYFPPSIMLKLESCLNSRRKIILGQTDNGNTYRGCEHGFWSKILWCLSRKANRRHRKLRQLLGGPPAAQGDVCSWTLWDPLERQAEKWKRASSERSRPPLALSLYPRDWDAVGEDHTSLTSIYHFVRERPTAQETIKHCQRPRYQTPQWLLDEEALPFSSESHYASGEVKHKRERDSLCHQNIYEGRINQMCHTRPPNGPLPRSKSGGPSDCVINLMFCFYCQLHNVQQLIRAANKCRQT